MKYERFTVKAREAISDAQNLAGKLGNPEIRPQHILMTLLEQDNGVVGPGGRPLLLSGQEGGGEDDEGDDGSNNRRCVVCCVCLSSFPR